MHRFDKLSSILDKIAEWSLYLMIFVLPFAKSIVEITIVTGLVSLVLKKIIVKERMFSTTSVDIFLYMFLIASLISLFNTSYLGLSLRAFFSKSLKFALLFFITKEIINTREKIKNLTAMALLSCAIILVDGFIQYFFTHEDLLHKYPSFKYFAPEPFFLGFPTASFPFPNDFAAWILIFIFPIGIFTFLKNNGWKQRAITAVIFIGLSYSLILTKVRGAWLGFLIAFGFLSAFKMKKLGIVLLVIFISAALLINKALIPDILSFTSVSDRSTMWKNSWEIFKKHPIIGNGLNTFYVNYEKVRNDEFKNKKGSYAHNCYLQMAAEIGLLGLIAFLCFIVALFRKAIVALKNIKDPLYNSIAMGLIFGILAFLVHSFFDTNLYSLNLSALFWLSSGFLISVINAAKKVS